MHKSQSTTSNKFVVSNQNQNEKHISLETTNDKLLNKLVNSNTATETEQQPTTNPTETLNDKLNAITQTESGLLYDTSLNFMNTFLIRIFSDFFTENKWKMKVKNKIQNKLSTIQMPYFMEGN